MPDRLQFTHNSDGVIELMLRMDERVRSLHINPDGVPWNIDAFQEPSVKLALFQYMTSTDAEGWIGWPELKSIFADGRVDVDALIQRHPASR